MCDTRGFVGSDPADARGNAVDACDPKRFRGSKSFAAQLNRGVKRAQAKRHGSHRKYREGLAIDVFGVESAAVSGGRNQVSYFDSPTISDKRILGCDCDASRRD